MNGTLADRILGDLRSARDDGDGWVCSRGWATWTVSYSQRISIDLAGRGYVIEARPCKRIEHQHRSSRREYRLVAEPRPTQLALAGVA